MIDSASDPDQGYEIRAASSVDRAFVPPNWYNVTAPLISVEALNTKDFSELILVGLLQRVGGSVGLDVTTRWLL